MKLLHLGLLSIILLAGRVSGSELTQQNIDDFYNCHARTAKYQTYPEEMIVEAVQNLSQASDLEAKKAIIGSYSYGSFTQAYNDYLGRHNLPYPEISLFSPLTYSDPENIQVEQQESELPTARYLDFHAPKEYLAQLRGFLSAFTFTSDDILYFNEQEKNQLFISLCYAAAFSVASEKSVALAKSLVDSVEDINQIL